MAECDSGLDSFGHGPLDFCGDEMEVDPAASGRDSDLVIGIASQCTEDSSGLHDTSPTTPNSRLFDLCLFDKSLTDQVQSTMRCMRRYDVNEPIGCALLLGSDGTPESPHDLISVGNDLETMGRALEEGGWDVLCRATEVCSRTLREQLTALGKEDQLRHLGQQTRDLANYSVFMLYYTGHGTAEGVVLNDGELVRYRDIVTKIAEVPCLSQKPKIFIFDSCRRKKMHNARGHFVATKDLPYSGAIEDNYRQDSQNSHNSYPPPHTVICFSAAEGQPSFQDKVEGSFYTLALSHALRQFGSEWSFHEIITQVNGGTQEVARSCNEVQNPIFRSNLEKLLVLNANENRVTTTPLSESQHHDSKSLVVSIGGVLVQRDVVPKDPKVKTVWKSKEQVMSNIGHLGDGVSVFFIYAPNPDDAHKPVLPEDKWELRNRYLMSRLFFDLELHGFHVMSDLHLGSTEPFNWVQWYISRISHCNFVVFVCSPAFKELFEADSPQKFPSPKAKRLVEYRNAVYAGISSEMSKEGRKFVPVVLDSYETHKCVPLLFQPGTIYRVPKEDQRKFDFDNRSRDFEKLVCHMAGINRNDLEPVTQVSQVPTLPGPFDKKSEMDLWSDDCNVALLNGPPEGYVVSIERPLYQGLVGPPQPGQSARRVEQHHVGVSPSIASSQAPPPHDQLPHPPSHRQPHPQSRHQHPVEQPPQEYHQHPHTQPCPVQIQPSPQTTSDALASLPARAPNTKVYLWLSKVIASWMFIARELGLDERVLERVIADHHLGGTDELCYQMFLVWAQRFSGNGCDYRTLGRVLQDSDKNRHLCAEYVQRVKDIEKLQ